MFGGIVHTALDTLYQTEDIEAACKTLLEAFHADPYEDVKRSPMVGAEMLAVYDRHWKGRRAEWDLLAIEQYFEYPIYGETDIICDTCGELPPDMSHRHGGKCHWLCEGSYVYRVVYCGLVDKVVQNKKTGEVFGIDHKTTSYLNGSYLQAMKLSSQFMGYYYWLKAWSPWKENVSNTFIADFLLTAKKSQYAEAPNTPLRRETIHATPEILEEWVSDTQHWIEVIQSFRAESGYTYGAYEEDPSPTILEILPPKNPDSCSRFNSLCSFYDLCSHPPSMRETHVNMLYDIERWNPKTEAEERKASA